MGDIVTSIDNFLLRDPAIKTDKLLSNRPACGLAEIKKENRYENDES